VVPIKVGCTQPLATSTASLGKLKRVEEKGKKGISRTASVVSQESPPGIIERWHMEEGEKGHCVGAVKADLEKEIGTRRTNQKARFDKVCLQGSWTQHAKKKGGKRKQVRTLENEAYADQQEGTIAEGKYSSKWAHVRLEEKR